MATDPEWEGLLRGAPIPIQLLGAAPWQLPTATGGTGVLLRTNLGPIRCLYHPAAEASSAVIWVGGARGGFDGGGGLYPILADELTEQGLSSLRLSYRKPNDLFHSMLDMLVGVEYLRLQGCQRVALVGHSFGGAVVIAAAPLCNTVVAVAGLASQSYGAQYSFLVAPRPLLLVHGLDDTRLGPHCSRQIHALAQEPKELVLYPGAGHGLRECREQLHELLSTWLVERLKA